MKAFQSHRKRKSKIKKDPIKIKSFKENSILNDEIRNTNIDKDEIKNLKNISQIKQYEKLTGFKLLDRYLFFMVVAKAKQVFAQLQATKSTRLELLEELLLDLQVFS